MKKTAKIAAITAVTAILLSLTALVLAGHGFGPFGDNPAIVKKLEITPEQQKKIEERLLKAYLKIRNAYRNGLAVVTVERNACGGCFNAIPPQLQMEIALTKKILVCEHCGRILIDKASILTEEPAEA